MSNDTHDRALLKAYSIGRNIVLWIAILLLIKSHLNQQTQLDELQASLAKMAMQSIKATTNISTLPLDTAFRPSDEYGNLQVYGTVIVDGCILWRQTTGNYQNICTVFTEIFQDCVNGKPSLNHSWCDCYGPWTGPLCDQHTCFNRGIYDITRTTCTCMAPYTDESMCEFIDEKPLTCTFDGQDCQGTCVNGVCVCTRPGQLGRLCQQCAFPLIDSKLCPGRTNWGLDFVNTIDQFAVCGGGYEFSSNEIVLIRAMNCLTPTCMDFYSSRHRCCNPLSDIILCQGWQNWTYNKNDFATYTSSFNAAYRTRYLQIITEHDPFSQTCEDSNACLLRAHSVIQTSDWPQLALYSTPNQPYSILQDGFYLTLYNPGTKFALATWSLMPFYVYLIDSGTYFQQNEQLVYIFHYYQLDAYCLSDIDPDPITMHILQTSEHQQMYWTNLADQPGTALPPQFYCGKFRTKYGLQRIGSSLYSNAGSRSTNGLWFVKNQFVTVAAISSTPT